jgi:hypothetical protein
MKVLAKTSKNFTGGLSHSYLDNLLIQVSLLGTLRRHADIEANSYFIHLLVNTTKMTIVLSNNMSDVYYIASSGG